MANPATGSDALTPLSAAVEPLCSLGLFANRVSGSLVGRDRAMGAVERAFEALREHMVCLAIEGEPGIGKTRLLLALEERARSAGFAAVAVTADEEISGPFLLARSIFSSPAMLEAAQDGEAGRAVERALDALSDRSDPGFESMSPDRRLVRVYDLAAVAIRALAAESPVAILIDDLQWADEDSLRLLRYVARTDAMSPLLLALAIRPDETAFVNEAVTLLADTDRMGILNRIRLERLSQLESTQLLQQVLGGRIDLRSAEIMHAQAEGVPFILTEEARAYRDSGLIQEIDGTWTIARNADRLLPSAVRTLIERRAARLDQDTKTALAEAGALGRSFSLRDLGEVRRLLGGEAAQPDQLAALLSPAVAAGLLLQHPDGAPADYTFTHDSTREYLAGTLAAPRRRAIHGAIVDMLLAGGDPPAASLPLIAQHALAAGRGDLCARMAIEAATAALATHAPEEVLRLVEMAQPVASGPQNRVALLRLRDDALDMLRRSTQRLDGLTELAALAEALGDSQLELEAMLRRAAAFRLSGDDDVAIDLSRRAQERAVADGDERSELTACIELGQELLGIELGEGYSQIPGEADMDGAAAIYQRAAELAERLGDEPRLAAATRELGIIELSRVRIWFVEQTKAGAIPEFQGRILAGEQLEEIAASLPIAETIGRAQEAFRRALEIYERLGDRQGVMTSILAMAMLSWAPGIHVMGSPQHIEEIRRLTARLKSFTRESERQLADAQMLFGAHVYARHKVFPDVAIEKGDEAYRAARAIGDRSLEFAIAGSMAAAHAEFGQPTEGETWIERAATTASAAPTPLRARQLEMWRALVRAASGDAAGMRSHFERAIELATDQGRAAARCELHARFAIEAARLGAADTDEELLALAERHAREALSLSASLPGHAPWIAQAHAALARVNLARGSGTEAVAEGREAFASLAAAAHEDLCLETVLPAAAALLAEGDDAERESAADRLRLLLGLIAQRFDDADSRARWFRAPLGRELTSLSGESFEVAPGAQAESPGAGLSSDDLALLKLLGEGLTDGEIAESLSLSGAETAERLAALYARIGASSRADAATAALTGRWI